MKFNSPYVSLGALILASSFVGSPLRADPLSVPAMKMNGDERRDFPIFEKREISAGGLEDSDKHHSKDIDIVLEGRGTDLFVVRDRNHEILRLHSKEKKIEVMGLAASAAVVDLLEKEPEGKFFQVSIYGGTGKEGNAIWPQSLVAYGLQEKLDGSFGGKVSAKSYKKLVDEMTWTGATFDQKTEGQEPKIKMVLSDSRGFLIKALKDSLKSGEFKTRYTDRTHIAAEILPAYSYMGKVNEEIKVQADGFFKLENGLMGHKIGDSWSLVDSEKNRFVFNSLSGAGEFQEWMREKGVDSGERAIAGNSSDPLISALRQKEDRFYAFGNIGISYDNEDTGFDKYDKIPENYARMIFITLSGSDFEKSRDAYGQFLQWDIGVKALFNPSKK